MATEPTNDVNATDGANEFAELGAEILGESTSTEESSTEETKETKETKPAVEEQSQKTDEATETTETEDESETKEDESDETKDADKPKRDAEARKEQLNKEIRQLVAEKKQRQAEVERLNSQVYRTESQEELVAAGLSPDEAKAEADRQSWEMEKFNRDITDLNQTIDLQVAQVMTDFPWADPESQDYDPTIAKSAYELFQKAGQPVVDERTGFVTNINVMPYDIYAAFDATRRSSTQSGAVQGQKATEKMLAAAEPSSSRQTETTEDEEDKFLQGFNKV